MSLKRSDYGLGCFHDRCWLTGKSREKKSSEKLTPNADEVCEIKKRYFTKVCWGSHDLQLLFYTEVAGGSKWILEKAKKSHRSSNGLQNKIPWPFQAGPTLLHSHLSTLPQKGNLCSHSTNGLSSYQFFLECATRHCFTDRFFKFTSGISSGVREMTSLPGLGSNLICPDRTSIFHHCCYLSYAIILFSYVYNFPLDRLTEFLHRKGLPFHSKALVPT